jgi:putative transposase
MIHVTRYHVYPSRSIQDEIFRQFEICTDLRNWYLDHGDFDVRLLPGLKKEYPELATIHSVVLQNLVFQIRDNIKALHTLKSKGRKVGRLRHKRVRSLIYEQTGYKIEDGKIWFSKIGWMPITLSRSIPGKIKQIILKFTKTHKWFVSVISRDDTEPTVTDGYRSVGIDMGLTHFSTDTDGKIVDHPHNVNKAARRLRRAQRRLSRCVKGSANRKKQRLRVARIHETTTNRRDDFLHKWCNEYIEQYDRIAVEKLNITEMLTGSKTRVKNRNTFDAAWGKARTFLTYKAARAGRQVVAIDSAYTTQDCSQCGTRVPKLLSERTHRCPSCGLVLDRDLNAARNILQKAISIGWGTPESTLVEIGTATSSSAAMHVPVDETRIPWL